MTNGLKASPRPQEQERAFALLALVLAVLFALAGCGGGNSLTSSSTSNPSNRAIPVAVTASQLKTIARSAGHPIYWAGAAVAGGTYELTTIADGRTYIRYLPPGVAVGDPSPAYLTIGTYVRSTPPYAAIRQAALAKHATIRTLKGDGLAVAYGSRPQSVYMVYPGARYEVEVYDPSAATSLRLATSGKVVPIS